MFLQVKALRGSTEIETAPIEKPAPTTPETEPKPETPSEPKLPPIPEDPEEGDVETPAIPDPETIEEEPQRELPVDFPDQEEITVLPSKLPRIRRGGCGGGWFME